MTNEYPRRWSADGASLAAIVLVLLAFGSVMLLHALRGGIDPMRQVMSEYANGSHGPVMTGVFYAFGLSSIALAVRLRRAFKRGGATRLIPLLLAVAGVSLIASGVFEVERPLVPDTLDEVIPTNSVPRTRSSSKPSPRSHRVTTGSGCFEWSRSSTGIPSTTT